MTTRNDMSLIYESYSKIVEVLEDSAGKFIEHAPKDPERQMNMQARLMTATIAHFIQTMPLLSDDQLTHIMNFATQVARAHPIEEPSTNKNYN